jgi:hypothetical protein
MRFLFISSAIACIGLAVSSAAAGAANAKRYPNTYSSCYCYFGYPNLACMPVSPATTRAVDAESPVHASPNCFLASDLNLCAAAGSKPASTPACGCADEAAPKSEATERGVQKSPDGIHRGKRGIVPSWLGIRFVYVIYISGTIPRVEGAACTGFVSTPLCFGGTVRSLQSIWVADEGAPAFLMLR